MMTISCPNHQARKQHRDFFTIIFCGGIISLFVAYSNVGFITSLSEIIVKKQDDGSDENMNRVKTEKNHFPFRTENTDNANTKKRYQERPRMISTSDVIIPKMKSTEVRSGKVFVPGREFPHLPSLHLIGERNSGTNWMEHNLLDCFNGTVDFYQGYGTHKHWFQKENGFFDASPGVVVVAQFRNVYHWTKAMQKTIYHCPKHINLPWKEYLSKPWTMPRYNEDLEFFNQSHGVVNQQTCPDQLFCRGGDSFYRPYEVIPCLANWTIPGKFGQAFYELRDDGSGLPFSSILELRAAKIRNYLSVPNFSNVLHFNPVRYETMMRNGTLSLIRQLEQQLNVTAHCTNQWNHLQGNVTHSYGTRSLEPEFIAHVRTHVDWTTEALLGYHSDDVYGDGKNDEYW